MKYNGARRCAQIDRRTEIRDRINQLEIQVRNDQSHSHTKNIEENESASQIIGIFTELYQISFPYEIKER